MNGRSSDSLQELETTHDDETQVSRSKKELVLGVQRELSDSATWLPMARSVVHHDTRLRPQGVQSSGGIGNDQDRKSASQLRQGFSEELYGHRQNASASPPGHHSTEIASGQFIPYVNERSRTGKLLAMKKEEQSQQSGQASSKLFTPKSSMMRVESTA